MAPTQLQIKTNALARLLKEEKLYHQEVEDTQKRIDQLKTDNGDEYEIKKMVGHIVLSNTTIILTKTEVLEDTKKMIPELRNKIKAAAEKLKQFLVGRLDGHKRGT